jgi:uncharacterized membrane protein YqaE (UPF0057 family)
MADICYRIGITLLNIFFPPIAVALLTGLNTDCIINCGFFLLAVIPAHIHGFWISCTYFHRKRKVGQMEEMADRMSLIHAKG